MPVSATYDYQYPARDAVENFHGNQLTYVYWKKHLMFAAPSAFPLPPEMPFEALVANVFPSVFAAHPDWKNIDWSTVEWTLDDRPLVPDFAASLAANGFEHKSMLTFSTPGLNGIAATGT